MSAPLRWALFGASDIAATRMIPAIRALGHSVQVVQSSSSQWADSFAATHGIPTATSDVATALDAAVDAVYISSYNDLHHAHSMAALSVGKHVLCEKPMALSIAEAEQMVAAADRAGVVLAVNHHLPQSPIHRSVVDAVRAGRIGDLLSARIVHAVLLPERLRNWRIEDGRGGGVALDITCHDASVLNPLLGRARRVTALGVRQAEWNTGSADDAIMTVIEYDRDGRRCLAQTHDAFTVGFETTSLTVHGTTGTLIARDSMTQQSRGSLEIVSATGSEMLPVRLGRDLYEIVLDAFGGAVEGCGDPATSGREGIETLRVALAALEAVGSGRTVELD